MCELRAFLLRELDYRQEDRKITELTRWRAWRWTVRAWPSLSPGKLYERVRG